MKFKHVLSCKGKLLKQKTYEFPLISEEIFEQAKTATIEQPIRTKAGSLLYELYMENDKLHIKAYMSYDIFEVEP